MRGAHSLSRVGLILLVLACGVVPLWAQSGVIQGTVVDAQGAVIPNAKVSALDEAKGIVVRETISQGDGTFQLRPLLEGRYTVKAESKGFKMLERAGLVLDPNQIMNLGALRLEVGEVAEAITVQEEVPLVETATASKSFVLSSRQVTEISLNGRDFQSLMRTLPGVVSNDRSDFRLAFNNTDSFNTNGLRGSMNNFYLDGTINTDVGANDGQYTQLSMDAVGEFKEQNSVFNAEYGRNPGILLSATTKSGGGDFHGTAYEFLRNNALDARLPFDTTGKTAKLRFDQFGGNIGGPLYLPGISTRGNKKLFFFFNYEGTRASRPNGGNFVDTVHPELLNGNFQRLLRFNPDGSPVTLRGTSFNVGTVFQPGTIVRDNANNIIGGTPFPNNVVPQSMWSKNAPAFLNVINRLNRSTGAPIGTDPSLVRVPMQDTYVFSKNQKALRVDYNLSSKTNLFFRWVDDAQRESQGLGIFSGNSYPVFPEYRKKPGASWSWNLVNVISPTTTNEFIFGYNHLTQVVDVVDGTDTSTYDRQKLGFTFGELYPNSNVRNKFPNFSCGTGCGFSSFAPTWLSEGKTYAWTDNFTRIHGSHTFKTGVFFNMNDNGQQPAWTDSTNLNFGSNAQNPNDTGNTLANLLLGNYTSVSQSNGVFYGFFRFFGLEFYGQDSWKVSRKLTLEYGMRFAYLGPTYTRGRFLQNYFDPSLYDPSQAVRIETSAGLKNGSIIPGSGNPFNGMIQEGSPGVALGFIEHRKNNVAPRFGFAFDPWGDGKTAIRGGFGMFYERTRQNNTNFDGLGNPPLSYTPSLYGGNIDNLSPALIASGTRFPVGITAMNKDGFLPTIYSWSLDVQRQLPGQTSIDIAYVGNTARHLLYIRDLNQVPLGTTVNTSILRDANNTTAAVRPYKGYNSVNFTDYGANSNYNALQARVSRRFARNLTANVNYTWSRTFDIVDGDTNSIGYYLDRRRDYGPAGFDRRQTFTFDYVYQLPGIGTKWMNNAFGRKVLDGWQVSGITRFWSGPPLTVATANPNPGNPGTLGGGVRADYLGGAAYPDNRDRFNYFNPLVFGRPVDGSLGNTGKGILRAPGINNWDFSVFKNTKIGERVTWQFRFESFNLLNHTQWGGINTGFSVPNPGTPVTPATIGTTGQVNSTRDPRNIQLAMKLYF
jgi:hypothetical protein